MGKVLLASPRGYCAGVDRAVTAVKVALKRWGAPIYVRREIVHNKFVVQSLTRAGAIFVESVDEVPRGARVVFSAHGVAPQVYEAAESRGLQVIDATCPLVTKVHREARRFAAAGYNIVLIGHAGHEEVEGTLGQAPERIHVIDTDGDVNSLPHFAPSEENAEDSEQSVVWLSQTTLSVDQTEATVERLRARYPGLENPPSDDICFATQNRQGAVKTIAPHVDVMVVVGSANSSNSVRLVEVAREAGAKSAYRVEWASELEESWFEGAAAVGLTSGASVPEVLVEEVLSWLADHGFADVETVETSRETTSFSLPKPLR